MAHLQSSIADPRSQENSPTDDLLSFFEKLIYDPLSTFLAKFPTQLHYKKPQSHRHLWVFWSQNEQSQENSSTDDPGLVPQPDPWVIHEKIKSAFSQLYFYSWYGYRDVLIQFWAPVTTGGRRLLTTSGQPFALNNIDTGLEKYRLCSLKHQYDVDVNKLQVEEDPMIITGGPASAFLNQLAEVVLDLGVHKGSPLVSSALECEFKACFVLPICDPSRRCCVGVVECVMKLSNCASEILDDLTRRLKEVDLSTFHVQERLPYKTINGLKHARDEIEEALKIVCESHNLHLAQVWIPCEEENHVTFSSSMKDGRVKQKVALKLVGYHGVEYPYSYSHACDVLAFQMGEGLPGKAFQNDELRFCRDISKLSNTELLRSFDFLPKLSCFVIRLRSNYTCDFDYVFEFLWPRDRNYVILLESLLFTLKKCLPNFKFASGAKLGHGPFVVDVENSSGSEIRYFKICEGNRFSPKPKASEEGKRPMVEECIAPTTMVNSANLESLYGDELSTFLAMFPTQPYYNRAEHKLWVFWTQNERSQNNSFCDDPGLVPESPDHWAIYEKIKSTFSVLSEDHFVGLIQFWAPVTTGGRRLLTTSGQPFGLTNLYTGHLKYRLCSLKYQYDVDVNKLQVEEDPMIITGGPASAFLNQLAEVVLDLRVHKGCPLVRSALERELMECIVLPICDPSRGCCVGVVECVMRQSKYALKILNKLIRALKKADLSTFYGRERLPYKTTHDLEPVRDEIGEALKIVCESHDICLAQVWIPFEEENHVPFSSSTKDARMKPVLPLINLVAYPLKDDSSFGYYRVACDMLPLQMSDRLLGMTLQNHEPHFCRSYPSNLGDNELLGSFASFFPWKSNCFAVCLRSMNTLDFDYVFEFLWLKHRDDDILLESLLLTLKRSLPRFKFASGAELGDELHVVDVDNSSGSEIRYFKIFKDIRSSPIPEASEEGRRLVVGELLGECMMPPKAKHKTAEISMPREDIERQFGRTMKEAAKNLNVSLSTLKRKCKEVGLSEWQGPKFGKRKMNDSYNNQTDTNEEDNGAIQDPSAVHREMNSDENTLTIKAKHGDDVIKFRLPIPLATFVAVQEEIGQRFGLNNGSHKLKYQDEDGEWILMNCDQDMRDCIQSWRLLNSTAIRLLVLSFTR